MKISFLGAARTVTGSCFVVETATTRFAINYGMYQGNKDIEKRNLERQDISTGKLDFILVTHAHIDHSGLLPKIVKDGFSGPIYCTTATLDLLDIMLRDSAHIQEMEAKWENKKRLRKGLPQVEPLYTQKDAEKTIRQLKAVEYGTKLSPVSDVRMEFNDAGHILGSSFIELWITENGKQTKLVFSGDLGRPDRFIIRDPETEEKADYLFLESTYGDRNHKNEDISLEELAEAINSAVSHGQKTIIPAFAIERSQEIIYALRQLKEDGKIPKELPVYLDSPLAIKATEIFRTHKEYYDQKTKEVLRRGVDPLDLPNLEFTLSTEDSMAINEADGPAVVISASGMANAGRIKHHLRHNIWRHGASIVFVGFQAAGTPGRRLVDGAKTITLMGEELVVNANIYTIGGFSAHAGQSQILDWVSNFNNPNMEVFLVHGEYKAQQALAELIKKQFHLKVHIPDYMEKIELAAGKVQTTPSLPEVLPARINWNFVMDEMQTRIDQLRDRTQQIENMEWADQTDIRDDLLQISAKLTRLLSEVA